MELKRAKYVYYETSENALNRTKLELKQFLWAFVFFVFDSLNRTKLELKSRMSIVWNSSKTNFKSHQIGIEIANSGTGFLWTGHFKSHQIGIEISSSYSCID